MGNNGMNIARVERLAEELLREIGENPQREGLQKTPARLAKALEFLTAGYGQTVEQIVNGAIFAAESRDMIICRDIEVYSLCEHHLLPFYGKCHIGYIPRQKLLGISKLVRIVNLFARRLQIQERLTAQIAEAVRQATDADGVGVVLECRHMCMLMRGVEKQNSSLTTSSVLGSFRNELSTRAEFTSSIRQ
jgi:GTP cyclohydrolase I